MTPVFEHESHASKPDLRKPLATNPGIRLGALAQVCISV